VSTKDIIRTVILRLSSDSTITEYVGDRIYTQSFNELSTPFITINFVDKADEFVYDDMSMVNIDITVWGNNGYSELWDIYDQINKLFNRQVVATSDITYHYFNELDARQGFQQGDNLNQIIISYSASIQIRRK